MSSYSQNNEQQIILDYFGDKVGTLLDIGANDGITLSNSRKLIENGWVADLVEPAPGPFEMLQRLYEGHPLAKIHDFAIADFTGIETLFESGEHLTVNDRGLLSSLSFEETSKWGASANFNPVDVCCFTFADFQKQYGRSNYDFITIDAEGYDLKILKQIDLKKTGTSLVCVEWNGKEFEEFDTYLAGFGMKLIAKNAENLIYGL